MSGALHWRGGGSTRAGGADALSSVGGRTLGCVEMIRPAREGIEVYVCVEPVDMRKQINGLATLVEAQLEMNPFSAQLFVFSNRRRTQVRILVWERSGFVLWTKRLEKQRFAWPKGADTVLTLSGVELNLLLDGYDIWRVEPHATLHYASMV